MHARAASWGTLREDCSSDGNAWDCFSHDQSRSLKVRSMVGLLPLCASIVLEPTGIVARSPRLKELISTFVKRHPELLKHTAPADERFVGYGGRRLLAVSRIFPNQRNTRP